MGREKSTSKKRGLLTLLFQNTNHVKWRTLNSAQPTDDPEIKSFFCGFRGFF